MSGRKLTAPAPAPPALRFGRRRAGRVPPALLAPSYAGVWALCRAHPACGGSPHGGRAASVSAPASARVGFGVGQLSEYSGLRIRIFAFANQNIRFSESRFGF